MTVHLHLHAQPRPVRARNKRGLGLALVFVAVGMMVLAGGVYFRTHGFPDINIDLRSLGKPEEKVQLCIEHSVPSAAVKAARAWATGNDDLPSVGASIVRYSGDPSADCAIDVTLKQADDYDLVWRNYFVVAASQKNTIDALSVDELVTMIGEGSIVQGASTSTLAIDASIKDNVARIYGVGINVAVSDDVASQVEANAALIGIVPFDQLSSNLKEIRIGSSSLLNRTSVDDYPLREEIWMHEGEWSGLFEKIQSALGPVNYDAEQIRTVVITGTSVVNSRGQYRVAVEKNDWLYPVRATAPIMQEADIAHISNEESFVAGCVQPKWTMAFCAPTEAFEAVTWAGIDVVGLTGNHILDYGKPAFLSTLDRYTAAGITYFGGGINATDAHTPKVIDLGTIKVAFLGYNMIPPVSYSASGTSPGSASLTEAALKSDIPKAKEVADFVFVDMQWGDEYSHSPNTYQVNFGHSAVDAGADVVSGVHPHWVQSIENYSGSLIFYGLGNYLFDQTWSQETREGIMVRHYFYGDRYVGYELIPTYLSDEYQPQVVEGADRMRILGYARAGL